MVVNIRILSFLMSCLFLINPAWADRAEPVQACVIHSQYALTPADRQDIARCLGWVNDPAVPLCRGHYQSLAVNGLPNPDEIQIQADQVSFSQQQRSRLQGHVQVQQGQRIVNADTAYIYRDAKTNQVTRIELIGAVRYQEPDRLMLASKANLYPQDKAGQVEDVLYLFAINRQQAELPAWGRASLIKRFANQDYLLQKTTYTTCAPQDKSWELRADEIRLDHAAGKGVARRATLLIHDNPVFYLPYMSFPTNRNRKSGFLLPTMGYSNVGGYDLALPFYWNMAPNYDATLVPHYYSKRGVMLGGEFRYLTEGSVGVFDGHYLPKDRAYSQFLQDNSKQFPFLANQSTDRWLLRLNDTTQIARNLQFNLNFQEVSDDYYLQDFSTNLAVLSERQLLRQADLTYTTNHWLLRGMAQGYQTLNPVNQTRLMDIYERLPQVMARGYYADLPGGLTFNMTGLYDQFHWPEPKKPMPQGPRLYANPVLSLPLRKPWGYLSPSLQLVETYYDIQRGYRYNSQEINRFIPRYSVDGGLFFERDFRLNGFEMTQTLEPRLFYLNVPYQNQSNIPVFDSAYMIFNTDQLFRFNRFSGYDRIGDANQLAYAVTSRFISDATGFERASLTLGQIRYFANRQVKLCQSPTGYCVDNPLTLGQLPDDSITSPLASRLVYHFNPRWQVVGDYVYDPATRATNNGNINFHYQPAPDRLLSFGYSYLVNGDVTQVANSRIQDNALNQAVIAYAWPLTEKWSTLGAYSYNISKNYTMMSFLGVQYDTCCWAIRAVGGQTFQSLNNNLQPQYNNNFYLQFLLKGLGSLASNDPYNTINTYLPTYRDKF